MKTYFSFIKATMKEQARSPGVLLIRACFMCLMLIIFNQFWSVLKATGNTAIQLNASDFLWYLLIGCILQFSRPEGLHKQIEDDVKSGSIAYQLIRPINIIAIYFCQSIGTFLIRTPFLFLVGSFVIYLLTDTTLPSVFHYLPFFACLLFLSICFISLCTVFIGLSTLYLQDSLPFFWIVQKCEYVLGGLFFPIIFYPDWLYHFCLTTPFAWSGYAVSSLMYNWSFTYAFLILGHLVFWNLFMVSAVYILYLFIKKRVSIHG